jgi:FtsZ-binding cell division protein ZapB
MYPDLNKIEQSHDKPPSGSIGIGTAGPSDSADDAKRRLIETSIESVRALKGFIAEYDRVTEERDQLKRQMTGSLAEVEMLREEVQQLKVQRDQFSSNLSTLTSQMETVVRKARHLNDISDGNRWFAALRNGKERRLQADFKGVADALATPADPSSIRLVPDAPATRADPSSTPWAPDLADFMAKVPGTWAVPSSIPRASDLADPSTPAVPASKAE